MLDRLIGLETEYATLVRPPLGGPAAPTRRAVYDAICEQISRRMPTARGRYDADTIFLANGGAFSMESSPMRLDWPGGLIEGATPEAASPARLIECQRAQDRLIAEAAECCRVPGIRIVKSSCDAHGHVYGCQENYSAPVAQGVMLWVYWLMLLMVLPPSIVYWCACLGLLALEVAVLVMVRLGSNLLGGRPLVGDGIHDPIPAPLLKVTAGFLRLVSLPAAGMLYLVARLVAFRRQRKFLTAFLVSRVVLTGAGYVDRRSRFRLSSKAIAIDTVTGFGGYRGERPIYVFHHWLQQLCGRSLLSSRSVAEMFRRRQRLQIGLSDSNVSDTAEYLKVATTSLVLDMIEAGGGRELPRLSRPIPALHRIACDWNLISRVSTSRGEMSALEIQRAYYLACVRFVRDCGSSAPEEAHEVLRRWEDALDALAAFRSAKIDARPGLGHVDWLTKKWMLDRIDADATGARNPSERWAARKKIDICYHELSESSYFARLRSAAPEVTSVDPAAIDLALRMPPVNSPALRRGQLIREFADGTQAVAVDWSHVVIGSGRDRRIFAVS